ncbi:site-2 protease family protein [bacterium]|nr:site-2 protease family protein [bacterium]
MTTSIFPQIMAMFAQLLPAFILVFSFYGFSRALAAKLMGDHTAQHEGFLTLNPAAHIDIFGMLITLAIFVVVNTLISGGLAFPIIIAILILIGARWRKIVPINEEMFRHHRLGILATTLAGPIGSFFLTFLSCVAIRFFPIQAVSAPVGKTVTQLLGTITELSAFWGVLELIPFPPFDGGRLLQVVLPRSKEWIIEWFEIYGVFVFLALIILPGVSTIFIGGLHTLATIVKLIALKIAFIGA